MKKAKLVQAFFTQEEIAAINTENIKLKKENKRLKEELWILDCKGWTPELVWHSEFLKYLIEENKKLKEEMETLKTIVVNNDLEQKADWKHIEELEEKYEKLKADYIKLSKIVEINWGYRASYVNELRDKIAKLEQELEIWMLTAKDYARLQWVDLEDSPRL